MKTSICVGVVSVGLAMACQAQWVNQRLNDIAVTNEFGQMIVLHDGGGHYQDHPNYAPERSFELDNPNMFYDAKKSTDAWIGFELQMPKIITGINYTGRANYRYRVLGTLVQGANTSDFSDAVTLWELSPPEGWNPTQWYGEHFLNPVAATNSFTFVRVYSTAPDSCGGDFTRIEFFGADPMSEEANPPNTPSITYDRCINWRMNLFWTGVPSSVILYEFERKIAHEDDFSPLTFAYATSGEMHRVDMSLMLYEDTDYRLRAINVAGTSDWVNVTGYARNSASGTWIGTLGSWGNNGNTGDKAFDGNLKTAINGHLSTGFWTGLDFGTEREITHVNFLPRSGFPQRMNGGIFEAADNTNFVNATTFYTIGYNPPENTVTEIMLDTPVTTRYVRYYPPNTPDNWGDVAELEFLLSPIAPNPPNGLTVATSCLTNAYAVLTWRLYDVGSLISSVMVYRAVSPGGPYALMTPDGIGLSDMGWTDETVIPGELYYYKLASLFNTSPANLEGEMSGYVTYISSERLEREWSDPTQLKSSALLLGGEYIPYNGHGAGYEVERMFDGNLSTFPDTSPGANGPNGRNPAVGVDLGKPYCIHFMRFAPRPDNYGGRLNGAELRGSNDPIYTNNFVRLATFTGAVDNQLITVPTETWKAFQYIFVQRPDDREFFGNIAELELYGWDPAVSEAVFTAPTLVTLSIQSDGIRLDWENGTAQDGYRIQRSADGVGGWVDLDDTPGPSYTDKDPLIGQRAFYRVAAVREVNSSEELAHSDVYDIVAYTPGNGIGLNATYYTNYFLGYHPSEAFAGVFLEDAPNWSNPAQISPHVSASTNDVRIVWYGKLIVPFTGDYTFYATSDDGVAIRIDDEFVINAWRLRGATMDQATVPLTKGEHLFRIDYFQEGGGKAMKLEWGGALDRAVIPTTQLLPLDLPDNEDVFVTTGEWQGRTFGTGRLGYHTTNANGSVTIGGVGGDLHGGGENFYYAWQTINGDFIFDAKVDIDRDPNRLEGKAMLIVRDALSYGSPLFAVCGITTNQNGKFNIKQRVPPETEISDGLPQWTGPFLDTFHLRIKRLKGTFSFAYRDASGFAAPWEPLHEFQDTDNLFSRDLYIGMAVCAPFQSSQKMFQTATFSEISIKKLNGTILILK